MRTSRWPNVHEASVGVSDLTQLLARGDFAAGVRSEFGQTIPTGAEEFQRDFGSQEMAREALVIRGEDQFEDELLSAHGLLGDVELANSLREECVDIFGQHERIVVQIGSDQVPQHLMAG